MYSSSGTRIDKHSNMASNDDDVYQEGEQTTEPREFNLDDLLKNWKDNETDEELSEDGSSPDKSEGVSMFCKACLNPYSGEAKSGTIVLKCERCGQTDVMLEEKAADLDPEEWSGNLMCNRFLQVIKEQEDLQLNILEPDFVEDDYQHLSFAIQEFTSNMKGVSERMFDIARKAGLNFDSETMNEQEVSFPDETDTNMTVNADAEHAESDLEDWMPSNTQERLKRLGASVTKLMHSIIKKHKLPPDIMDCVEQKIRQSSASSNKAVETSENVTETDNVSMASNDETVEKITETVDDGSIENVNIKTTDIITDLSEDVSETATPVIVDQDINNSEKEASNLETVKDDDENQSEVQQSNSTEDASASQEGSEAVDADQGTMTSDSDDSDEEINSDPLPSMVVTKEKIKHEIFDVLKSKFSVKFESTNEETPLSVTNTCDKKDEVDEDTKPAEAVVEETNISQSQTNDTTITESQKPHQLIDEIELEEENQSEHIDDEDEIQVNFFAASSVFIHELQARRKKALLERKDKALQIVHQKIVALKEEVERVENRVHDELKVAYKKKLKKSENQRKQLDKRHETIQDVERLLTHYARTGQNDKLQELMDQLNLQFEN